MTDSDLLHVLIIEDDPGTARLQQKVLARSGYRVTPVAGPDAARDVLAREDVHLILFDYRLADGRDGLEFYQALKRDGIHLPAIMVTGFPSETLVIQAMRAGVRDFVTKSTEYLDLLTGTVDHVLRRALIERKLVESEELHRITLASVSDAVLITDDDGRFVYVSPGVERMFGIPADVALGLGTVDRLLGPVDFSPAQLAAEGELVNLPHAVRNRRGEEHDLLINIKQVSIRGGTRLYTCRDVTAHRRVESALQTEREFSAHIVGAAPFVICQIRPDGETQFVNPAITQVAGYEPHEIIGQNWWSLFYPGAEHAQVEQLFQNLNAEGVRDYEMRLTTRDGRQRTIAWNSVNRLNAAGELESIIGIGWDVTERKLLEEQLRQSQKMEAVGSLAGGIAHDFNNLLTVILGNGELALELLQTGEPVDELLEDIMGAARRASALTRQLLAFSRKQLLNPQRLDVNRLVSNIERLLQRVIGEDIELRTSLTSDLPLVKVDPSQFEQILLNLAVNARDAMPRGGRLTIATSLAVLDEDYSALHPAVAPGPYIQVAVSDTGTGIPKSIRNRIFEPFFTTKATGKGTGLGLATVFGIVQQSGGHIAFYSEESQGTTFRIVLPATLSAGEKRADIDGSPPRRGSERVLLIEDEPRLRELTRKMLERDGYEVRDFGDPEEAAAIDDETLRSCELLLTDVVMPGMSGPQAADKLTARHPELKVLFMSGHTEDAVIRHGVDNVVKAFLQKPFSRNLLSQKLRGLLDGGETEAD
ncbi:MAG: response regulator [Planctomyces sp.]|nr:response regulator [Planctomyces sp.]